MSSFLTNKLDFFLDFNYIMETKHNIHYLCFNQLMWEGHRLKLI